MQTLQAQAFSRSILLSVGVSICQTTRFSHDLIGFVGLHWWYNLIGNKKIFARSSFYWLTIYNINRQIHTSRIQYFTRIREKSK